MPRVRSAEKKTSRDASEELVSAEGRRRMIAEAAYFRAQKRGFDGGDPVDDWLAAEREIDAALPGPEQRKEEALVYEKLEERVKRLLADAQDAVNAETVRRAFDRATEEIKKTGAHTAETVAKIAASMRKDMASAAQRMGPRWEGFSKKPGDLFEMWRDRSNVFLTQASGAVAEWLQQAGARFGQQPYHTGEMVYRGTFQCTACGEYVVLAASTHLPACPRCQKMEFRRT